MSQDSPVANDEQPVSDAPSGRILVAIVTYRRPAQLMRMLPVVLAQARELDPKAEVLVVDNDPEQTASAAVGELGTAVRYASEPEPGIAAARNRAIQIGGDADALVFIDDDEIPADGWLRALVERWRTSGCDGVTGPVVSQFEQPVDEWVTASGYFDEWVFGDGELVPAAASNNLLLDLRTLRRLNLWFDPAFGLTGGSDSRLSWELVRRGGRIIWAPEAKVTEIVPADRANRQWVRRRITRTANAWARVQLDLADSRTQRMRVRMAMSARGVAIAGRGAVQVARARLGDAPERTARGSCEMARGSGLLTGLWGHRVVEYAREPQVVSG